MAIHSNLISLLFLATAITILTISPPTSAATRRPQFNVVRFGARPDGRTDSTRAFLTAWTRACGSRVRVIMLVPKGRFLVRNMQFTGPCKNRSIFVRILGTIVAPNNIWTTGNSPHWIEFHRVDGVTISGGVLDGKGAALWACNFEPNSAADYMGMQTLSISNSQNVVVSRLTSLNSHMFHMVINFCHNVKLQGVRISAPGNSPNTDGIHVQFSTAVSIVSSKIATGDDCVSIGPGTANMLVDKVTCGPGHGISIGSLGKDVNEQGVQNVTVRSTTFVGTTNGFRIKAWGKPSNGFARNILFQHATMYNVQNPIFIDQRYCPDRNCADQGSGVRVSDVTYQNIRGTSATQVAVNFDCSNRSPCRGIRLNNVRLTYRNRAAVASCRNAGGTAYGFVQPRSCL
ncbi:unnamed protein product [Linum tenue]|uniref:Polygalacturonase n=1 Tax=Linum tenue TaxID=586396 RepID=A0AAV0PHF8_9ROSI|nr:unnamed protein product [Linum tenue]